MSSKLENSNESSQWEHEGGALRPSVREPEISQKLAEHGIIAIPLTVYELAGYRHTSAMDAIAAAEQNIR